MGEDVAFEIVKLLVQVAWADEDIADEEVEFILGVAQKYDVGATNLSILATCLRGEEPLPPPDFGLLRRHKATAIAAAEAMIRADAKVAADETAVLSQIRALLDG